MCLTEGRRAQRSIYGSLHPCGCCARSRVMHPLDSGEWTCCEVGRMMRSRHGAIKTVPPAVHAFELACGESVSTWGPVWHERCGRFDASHYSAHVVELST